MGLHPCTRNALLLIEKIMQRGVEDLAREALKRKIDYANNAKLYQDQWTAQHAAVERHRADHHAGEEKDDVVRSKS